MHGFERSTRTAGGRGVRTLLRVGSSSLAVPSPVCKQDGQCYQATEEPARPPAMVGRVSSSGYEVVGVCKGCLGASGMFVVFAHQPAGRRGICGSRGVRFGRSNHRLAGHNQVPRNISTLCVHQWKYGPVRSAMCSDSHQSSAQSRKSTKLM